MPNRVMPVPEGLIGVRADSALSRLLGISRTRAAEILDAGDALLDGRPLGRSERIGMPGVLDVTWREPSAPAIRAEDDEALRIVYLDDDVVVVDKPVGMVAHPATSWSGPTVLGVLAARGISVATSGQPERQGIVQRLDVGTSGLMMVARSERSYSVLKQMFRDHVVSKTYHAVAQGQLDPLAGTIDAPIGRLPKSDWKFGIIAGGKRSVTHYRTIEANRYGSLLEINLETGRTHQIRVHLSAGGHPLIGDPLYGGDPKLAARFGLTRQWLHAVRLAFDHPITGEHMELVSDYPADLATALEQLRRA